MYLRLLKVKDWAELARQAAFSPAAMAGRCRVSLRHLERFFAEHFHQTPRMWCAALRCRIAASLLAQGYSSKAAAAELGFASQAHFCHQFKRCFGVAPQSSVPISLKDKQDVALEQKCRVEAKQSRLRRSKTRRR